MDFAATDFRFNVHLHRRNQLLSLAGLNFTFNLCLYDGMLTFVEVNHHALLAEISVDSSERAR